jgi:hypothetical protein
MSNFLLHVSSAALPGTNGASGRHPLRNRSHVCAKKESKRAATLLCEANWSDLPLGHVRKAASKSSRNFCKTGINVRAPYSKADFNFCNFLSDTFAVKLDDESKGSMTLMEDDNGGGVGGMGGEGVGTGVGTFSGVSVSVAVVAVVAAVGAAVGAVVGAVVEDDLKRYFSW